MKYSSFNFQKRGFNFLLISLPYLLINVQEAVYTILTQLHSLGKKPKLCSWNTFLYAHQEYTVRYHYEHQSVADNCKLNELLASYGNGSLSLSLSLCSLPLFDQFLTNLFCNSLASRNSRYPYTQLTRCGTTAWQLDLDCLLLKSTIRTSWVVEEKESCCYWI